MPKKSKNSPAKCLALLGTGSDVGKSIVVTALCRIFHQQGLNVAPYKAQNMSNNSFVTTEGGEMGRAQIVQAQAACVEPSVDMNPVLLKPSTDTGAQVIVQGKPIGNCLAKDYFADTNALFDKAKQSLENLRSKHDLIIMEGAGSCAEVNLRSRDFVNFRIAHACDAPVILVADIDRGGVFAQIIGTLAIIPPEDRRAVKGIIINRFRGDASLFDDGIEYIEKETKLPVLGLIPYFYNIQIESEDGMPLDIVIDPTDSPTADKINIAVIRLPHISNFTDFDPLLRHPNVNLHYLARNRDLTGYDAVILPGSKNVRSDLNWLTEQGWTKHLNNHIQRNKHLIGICGGYQMLGKTINDPQGVEAQPGQTPALDFLDVTTTLHPQKILTQTTGTWQNTNLKVKGYEIHMGKTTPINTPNPVITITQQNAKSTNTPEGHSNQQGNIWGTYLHGLFDENNFRQHFLTQLRPDLPLSQPKSNESISNFRQRQYELLATHFRNNLNLKKLNDIIA